MSIAKIFERNTISGIKRWVNERVKYDKYINKPRQNMTGPVFIGPWIFPQWRRWSNIMPEKIHCSALETSQNHLLAKEWLKMDYRRRLKFGFLPWSET